jgi:methylmalonyl-CoA/ethylmalonyl-CoA epimerase
MNSPEIIKIDHIGIAVSDMENAIRRYKVMLLMEPSCVEYLEDIKLKLAFYEIQGVSIELLSPMEPHGDIFSFIKEKGESLHHICFEVNDISGSKIAFINSTSANGVLIEYCELPKKGFQQSA